MNWIDGLAIWAGAAAAVAAFVFLVVLVVAVRRKQLGLDVGIDLPGSVKATLKQVKPLGLQVTGMDQRSSALFQTACILTTERDLDAVLSAFLSCLIETLEVAEAGLVLLCDSDKGQLVVRSASGGYDPAAIRQVHLELDETLGGLAFTTGEPEVYLTPEAVARARRGLRPANRELSWLAARDSPRGAQVVCLPIRTQQAKLGVLVLEGRRRDDRFNETNLAFLQVLADLLALTIEATYTEHEERTSQALHEIRRLKVELISKLAHEMRTPLTAIKGYATALLMEDVEFDPRNQREFLQIIDQECDTLQDLIHDLLESSVIDAGLLHLEPQPIRLPRLVEDMFDDIVHRARGHSFATDFATDFPIVDADPARVAQVLRNLVDNAIKYSPDGGLVFVRGEVREGEVVISVSDQGIGIAPEHINRLFEDFFRADSGLDRHVVGSGLGLPIARTIVEGHGGRIWATSRLGHGSTFCFTLPLGEPLP